MNTDEKEIGQRLKIVRVHLGYGTMADFAKAHNFPETRYRNWENGTRRIPIDVAGTLFDRYGISLDWLYFGKTVMFSAKIFKEDIDKPRDKE